MPIEIITAEDFEPLVGEDFILPGDDITPAMHFTLIAVQRGKEKVASMKRWPFTVTFRTASQDVYQQGNYRLTHPSLDYQDIFLVPTGQDADGTSYNAYYS